MNYVQAVDLLRMHGGMPLDPEDPRMRTSFLGVLRPYEGRLHEEKFFEIMNAIRVVGETWKTNSEVDRMVAFSVWNICYTARWYGIEPTGMLQRNKIIRPEATKLLQDWVEVINHTFLCILRNAPLDWTYNALIDYAIKRRVNLNCEDWKEILVIGLLHEEEETRIGELRAAINFSRGHACLRDALSQIKENAKGMELDLIQQLEHKMNE